MIRPTEYTDLGLYEPSEEAYTSSPIRLSATTALTLFGKVRIGEAINEDSHLNGIMYAEQVRKIGFILSKYKVFVANQLKISLY